MTENFWKTQHDKLSADYADLEQRMYVMQSTVEEILLYLRLNVRVGFEGEDAKIYHDLLRRGTEALKYCQP